MSVTTSREAVYVPGLVRCPQGKFSWLKAVCLVVAVIPALNIVATWAAGSLGARPFTEAILMTGTWAVRFMLAAFAVTPTRAVCDLPRVVMLRRVLGVTAGCYAVAHVSLYVADEGFDLLHVGSEILHRFYLTIGCLALIGLVVLTITSTDGWQRRLGKHWRSLHRTIYLIAPLAIFHYFLQSKADISNAVFAAGIFFWLLLWRQTPRRWQTWRTPLLGVGVLAILATALSEFAWYSLATGISGTRVLMANLMVTHGLRPAEWIGVVSIAVIAIACARPLWSRRRVQSRARARALATE